MTDDTLACYLYEHCLGRDRAMSRADLCAALGCQDRALRRAVERLRRDGHVVGVAEGGGYFAARSFEEVQAIVDAYRARIVSECQTVALIRQNWPSVAGVQLVLVEDGGQGKLIA